MNTENMRIVKKNDWKTNELPTEHVTIDIHLQYSQKDKLRIIKGFLPKMMEDKWFVFFSKDVLNFHRSWTGFCVYRVHCCDDEDRFILTHADINRNRDQYGCTDDDYDRQMISYLIDDLLLKKKARFPIADSYVAHYIPKKLHHSEVKYSEKFANNLSTDFIRIIPVQRFVGYPALIYRPYAFYTDAESLKGRSIANCYSLVKALRLPPMAAGKSHCSPFIWNHHDFSSGDYDTPISKIKVKNGNIVFEDLPLKKLESIQYLVMRVSRYDAIRDLDVFPATWRALSYIISDPERMGVLQSACDMDLKTFASARIHARFKETYGGNEKSLLALTKSKECLGLNDLDNLPDHSEEFQYYSYLSKDSGFTNQIVELFGISSRCWHGCGYLGAPGQPICRFFLLLNKMTPHMRLSVLSGRDIIDPE